MKNKDTLILSDKNKTKKEKMLFSCYGITDIGKKRAINEDNIVVFQNGHTILAGIFDGMGGMRKGKLASKIAAKSVMAAFRKFGTDKEFINLALNYANKRIYEFSAKNSIAGLTGTTGVLAVINNNEIRFGNVGDSRLYIMHLNKLRPKTNDHTLVAYRLKNGMITEKQARESRQKNILLKALGVKENVEVETYEKETLFPGDIVLLCSDGLYNMIEKSEIEKILKTSETVRIKALNLIRMANKNGGADNISVILIEAKKSRQKIVNLGRIFRRDSKR